MKRLKVFSQVKPSSTFRIQITSMVDMFVILLVFLLKNFSTSEIQPDMKVETNLPSTQIARQAPVGERLIVRVGSGDLHVGDTPVNMNAKSSKVADPQFLPDLYKALNARKNQPLLIQASRDLDYHQLQKVLYTCSVAGFTNVSLAVLSQI
jgi:biopolymer transport protein ExbD